MLNIAQGSKRQRLDQSPRWADNFIEIDSQGDLVLEVGSDDTVFIRVSKKHMTTLSPVFDAMLSSRFAEGQTANDSVDNPLDLPDDDPLSMELMCKLAHQKITNWNQILPEYLTRLVVLCDKYGCIAPVTIWLHTTLNKWFTSYDYSLSKRKGTLSHQNLSLIDGMCVAFLTEERQVFARASKAVMFQMNAKQIQQRSCTAMDDLMPRDWRDQFLAEWKRQQRSLHNEIFQVIDDVCKQSNFEYETSAQQCTKLENRLGRFSRILFREKLLPHHEIRQSRNIWREWAKVLTAAKSCESSAFEWSCNSKCNACKVSLVVLLDSLESMTKARACSICLECIKVGVEDCIDHQE